MQQNASEAVFYLSVIERIGYSAFLLSKNLQIGCLLGSCYIYTGKV